MLLGNLVKSIDKKYRKISVSGISFDSKKVKKGNIFFAINGQKTTGNKFIGEAISKGASVIISNKIEQPSNLKIPIILALFFIRFSLLLKEENYDCLFR